MIVVDSSVWIANIRQTPCWQTETLLSRSMSGDILVGDIVLTEVLQGARNEKDATNLEWCLSQFEFVAMLGPGIAIKAARNYRHLRSLGFTMSRLADLIIGTFCIENQHELLHLDSDFRPMQSHLGLVAARPSKLDVFSVMVPAGRSKA